MAFHDGACSSADPSPEDLEQRARDHLREAVNELAAARARALQDLHPGAFIRHHPRIAAALGGTGALFLLRLLRRPKPTRSESQNPPPEPLKKTFGRSLLTSAARTAGKALPGVLVWAVTRRVRKGRHKKT